MRRSIEGQENPILREKNTQVSKQQSNIEKDILSIGNDIIQSGRFEKARTIPHHYDYDVAAHSMGVARYALRIARWLERRGVTVDVRDVVRASLLHDLGMTEDDVFLSPPSEKAYTHPVESVRIAREEFDAGEGELDAISHHMWPIGHITPHSRTGWILVAADKCSSIKETRTYFKRAINKKRRGA